MSNNWKKCHILLSRKKIDTKAPIPESQSMQIKQLELAVNGSDCGKTEPIKIKVSPIREPFIVETPEGIISTTGQNQINSYLYDQHHLDLPDDFDWVWATNRGTLPKRIQSHFYKEHKVKLKPSAVSELGNLGRLHSDTAKKFILDFTNRIDWRDGAFGDGGSCFWGSCSGAKVMLQDNGAYAVRAYKSQLLGQSPLDYGNLKGYARAWVVPITGNRLIVFNGYGETHLVFARLLALHFGCVYKRVELRNNGSDDGLLYINGCSGYVVGTFEAIATLTDYDFGWDDEADSRVYCAVCDSGVDEDNSYPTHHGRRMVTCCGDCAYHCYSCDEYYVDSTTFDEVTREYYCSDCYEKLEDRRSEIGTEVV